MPKRYQRKRTKGSKLPRGVIYVGRGSQFGNPFKEGDPTTVKGVYVTRESAVRMFRRLAEQPANVATIQKKLRGRDVACWCPLDVPCHADVLIEISNR